MSAVPLELVQTDPTGPRSGSGLDIAPDRLCILRRGFLGSRRGPCIPRASVREWRQGTPEDLRAVPWMTAAALVAIDRAAAADPHGSYLAVGWEGPATMEAWLFTGSPGAVDHAAQLLAMGPAAATFGTGGDPVGMGLPPRRRGGVLGGVLVLLLIAGVVGATVWLVRDRVRETTTPTTSRTVRTVRTGVRPPPPAPPGPDVDVISASPYGVRQVVGALASAEVVRAGWRLSAAPRLDGFHAVIPVRFGSAPGRVEIYPSYAAALGKARGRAVQTGNVVVRYPPAARREGLGLLVRAIQDA